MKVRTKSGLLTVLLAVVFALTLCAGLWLAMPKSSNNVSAEAETGLVPLYGDELAQNPSYHAHDQGGGSAVFWDAAPTQMRIHFKYVGDSAPTRPGTGGQLGKCVTELGKYILLTKDGVTKSVVEWAWGWYAPATVNDNGSYEIWICAGSENLNAISQITILAGLTWQDVTPAGDGYTATPVADAVVHKNYVIKFNEDKTNYELVSDTEPVGLVPLYGEGQTKSRVADIPSHDTTAYWGKNGLRLFFRMSGVNAFPAQEHSGGVAAERGGYFGNTGTNVSITAGGDTKTIAQWKTENKIAWAAPANGHGLDGTSVYELWINCGEGEPAETWCASITSVTLTHGLQWSTQNGPVAGAVLDRDYTLNLDEDHVWQLGSAGDPVKPDEKSITLLTQSDITGHFEVSADNAADYHGKLGVFWSRTQMRLYFKAAGETLPAGMGPGSNVYTNSDKIYLTDATGSKSLAEWHTDGKFSWADFGAGYGAIDPGYGQIIICSDAHPEWLAGIKSVTVKAGFQWLTAADTPSGYVTKEDMTIYNGGMEKGWLAEDPNPSEPESTVSVTPAHDDEINNSNYYIDPTHNVYWSDTQMRLFFKVKGLPVSLNTKHGTHQYTTDKIVFTTSDGVSQTLADLKAANKVAWAANSMHELSTRNPESLEIWVAVTEDAAVKEANIAWLKSVAYVTIKEGFQLLDDNSAPIKDAVVKETVYLRNDTTKWSQCTEQDIPKAETSVVPAYGHADATDGLYWGGGNMLRLMFTAKGVNPLPKGTADLSSETIWAASQSDITKYILINGEEYSKWSDHIGWIAPHVIQNTFGGSVYEIWICSAGVGSTKDNPTQNEHEQWLKAIKTVTLKEGFCFWNQDGKAEGAQIREDITIWNGGIEAGWQKYADSITATLAGGDIPQGANLEDYLTVKAKYGTEEEAVTGYTLEGYDNTKGGVAQTVTVKYQDKETTVSVTLKAPDKTLTDIELSGTTEFTVKRFEKLSTEGLIVKAKFSDESEQTLEAGQYTVQEFDPWTAAKSVTLKVSYTFAGKTCEKNITVNVDAPDTTKGLRVAYDNGMKTKMQEGHMYLFFTVDGVADPTNAITGKSARMASPEPRLHAWEYLIIDGKPATEWNSEGKLSWITVWGDTENGIFRILLNSSTDVTWVDNIKTITIKAGFSLWYCADGKDHHNDAAASAYQNWEGAVVKEDVVIYNGMEKGWQKGVASISATYTGGAITVGEHIDKSKLTVTAIYYDNSEPAAVTDYTLDESQLNTVGDKTVTVKYQDKTTTFTVNVKAAGKSVRDITLSGTSVSVKQFEKPDFSNIKVNVNYSDSTNASVGLDDQRVTLSAYDTGTMGNKQITVTYTEFGQSLQKTLTLKVEKPDLTKGLEVFWLSGENTYWLNDDGSSTQLRLHLKMKDGSELPQVGAADIGTAYNAAQHLKDYILINGQPYSAWSSRIAWIAPFELIQNMIDDQAYEIIICVNEGDADKEWLKGIHTVELKAGFRWFNASGDVEGAILKEDMILWNAGEEGWEKKATSIEASTTQKNPPIGAKVDLTKITGTITYFDGTKTTLEVEEDMIDVTTFENEGSETVTITYQDVTFGLTYIVSNEKITGIKVTHDPIKMLYRFGTLALDTRGIEVVKLFEDEEADSKNAIDIGDLTFEGYDPYCMEEKQTITVRYGNFTTTFEIKMEPLENGIEIDWGMSSFDTQINVEGLTVVILSPAEKELNPVKVPFDAPGVIDKLKINGKPAQEYVDKGVIDWVGFYTWRFVIALNTPDLVWGTESDGSHSAGKSYYVEGRSELIRTVELLPGFQVYTTRDGADHWDEAASMKYARAVEGSALTHNVLLYNADGHGWDRVLKQGAGANLDGSSANFKLVPAEDAITLKSSGKVTYKKGENISVRGFVFTLQFEDGGTEDRALSPIQIDTDTYDPDTLGEQNVKIEISGGVYYLKVTVTEDGQGGEQPGDQPGGEQPGEQGGEEKGGCGGILGINALMLMCGGCALALLRRRKK